MISEYMRQGYRLDAGEQDYVMVSSHNVIELLDVYEARPRTAAPFRDMIGDFSDDGYGHYDYNPSPGEHISKTIEVCVKKARQTGKYVNLKHNDRFLTVCPADTIQDAADRFDQRYPCGR